MPCGRVRLAAASLERGHLVRGLMGLRGPRTRPHAVTGSLEGLSWLWGLTQCVTQPQSLVEALQRPRGFLWGLAAALHRRGASCCCGTLYCITVGPSNNLGWGHAASQRSRAATGPSNGLEGACVASRSTDKMVNFARTDWYGILL